MKTFSVSVEKQMYCTGTVEVQAANAEEALAIVNRSICYGHRQTQSIMDWDDSEYIDDSFKTTGDVAILIKG